MRVGSQILRDWLELPLVCTLELILGEEVLLGLEGRASEVGRSGDGDLSVGQPVGRERLGERGNRLEQPVY